MIPKYRAWDKPRECIKQVLSIDISAKKIYCNGDFRSLSETEFVLMQYTGLKDKNKVEIYEGDVIKAGDELIYYVYYDEDYASFRLRRRNAKYALDVYLKCEIIGNIYENPELLKDNK